MRIPKMIVLAAWAGFGLADTASAQSSGAFGARSIGSSFSPAASNFSGSAAARGRTGGGGAAALAGTGGSLAGATTRGDATVGQITGNERFVRGNRQAGQFVGADAGDASNFFSQLSGAVTGQGNRNNNRSALDQLNTQSRFKSKARVVVVPGFEFAPAAGDRVSQALMQRLQKSQRIQRRSPLVVQMDGRTAVLTGAVATEHDRELVARLALLEPGVAAVRNDLTVAPGPSLSAPASSLPSPAPVGSSAPQSTPSAVVRP